eukprot:TRINITY_DN4506_c0_g1_i8.p1 TRINITY_DN4506_c0_g1~~TRINITY_DN4506_c0_g1_i8.p1  ORF type:complete len:174 (+),score=34.33 TRINITY_DN4506_c0_g1_i8:321-842(+)
MSTPKDDEDALIPAGMPVPEVKFDMGAVDEDAAKLFAPIPMGRVKMTIYVTALLLFVFGCGVLALAGSTRDRTERNRNIIIGVVMLCGSLLSAYSSFYNDRGGLQMVWLLNVWQMATGTKLIYIALGNISRFGDVCAFAGEVGGELGILGLIRCVFWRFGGRFGVILGVWVSF